MIELTGANIAIMIGVFLVVAFTFIICIKRELR